ncbi:MAG: hypothetical protein EOO77_34315 [Oxalobacteraceae bacterium]|nr:MAG: hypothetical protein EOO77_34315 [Oxalobacteraceae bacterium]
MVNPDFDWQPYGRHTPMFNWAGQTKTARLVGCHDSDTCRVVFDTLDGVKQFIVRVEGIDGPEMNSQDTRGLRARNQLLQVVAPGLFTEDGQYTQKLIVDILAEHIVLVTLELGQMDKYGRVLSRIVSADGTDVAKHLLDIGAVHEYSGKTKLPW